MPIKNTFKILLSNFSNTWKILLYTTIVFILGAGLAAGLVVPGVRTVYLGIAQTGLFENIRSAANAFFTRSDEFPVFIELLKVNIDQASAVLAGHARTLSTSYLFLAAILLVTNILRGLSQFTMCDIIDGDMTSGAKFGFMSRFIINLDRSFKYRLVWLITELPVNIIIVFAVWFCFSLLLSIIGVFAVFFAVALFVVLLSLKQWFFCCWLPHYAVSQDGVFDSIRLGARLSRQKFSALFSSYVLINVSMFAVHTILALFTCGVGLLISLPAASLFHIIYRMVTYFELSGKKYYNDGKTVVHPSYTVIGKRG